MIFDTDVLIWVQRGSKKAANLIEKTEQRILSVQTYMELLQCAQSKQHIKWVKDFLSVYDFSVLPLTENIGHRAAVYIEEYALSTGLRTGDAIIAATATENSLPLSTANRKHFAKLRGLELHVFTP